jgi:hypothetical protein
MAGRAFPLENKSKLHKMIEHMTWHIHCTTEMIDGKMVQNL